MKYEVEVPYSGILSYFVEATSITEAQAKAEALYESGEPDHNPAVHTEKAEGYNAKAL